MVDLFGADEVAGAVRGHEAVVNLATHIPPANRAAFRRAWRDNDRLRAEASRHLADAAAAAGAEVLVPTTRSGRPPGGRRSTRTWCRVWTSLLRPEGVEAHA